jgi:hypothetical protein
VVTRKSNCRTSCPPTTSSRANRNSSSRTNRRCLSGAHWRKLRTTFGYVAYF